MNRWMTCLALAGKCGDRGSSGSARGGRRVLRADHEIAERERAEAHAAALQKFAAG